MSDDETGGGTPRSCGPLLLALAAVLVLPVAVPLGLAVLVTVGAAAGQAAAACTPGTDPTATASPTGGSPTAGSPTAGSLRAGGTPSPIATPTTTPTTTSTVTSTVTPSPTVSDGEGGVGFALPPPGTPRRASLTNPPAPIPARVRALYGAAAAKFVIPWTLLAGIGMEETGHGRNESVSTAGAQGLMQFMPATFAQVGVDGDGDHRAVITDDADSVFSAANYLTRSGVTKGPDGVRQALYAYNHADWYVNDVLYYAHAYGGGVVAGDPTDCGTGQGAGDPALPPLPDERVRTVLSWAAGHVGEPYVYGANGPHAWDCSSFVQGAYRTVGIDLPRTARAQHDWLAAGHGHRIQPGQEHPGDLVFIDSYLGPNVIGHVMIVWDPATRTTIEAHSTHTGIGHFTYTPTGHQIFEVWRLGTPTP